MPKKFPGNAYDASNATRPKELFIKRKIYKSFAYYNLKNMKPGTLPPPVKDFWTNEDCLYGRVNTFYTPVLCASQRLIEVEEGVKLVSFVAEAYLEMKKEYKIANAQNRFPIDRPPLTMIEAVRGYVPPDDPYYLAIDLLRAIFIKRMMVRPDIAAKIVSLKSFMPIFLQFVKEQAESLPITFSSFIGGSIGTVLQTGLALEIAAHAHDSDAEKIKQFINHPYFEFYKTVALKYGFYIDMNAPWRLVANLSSEPMRQFMKTHIGSDPAPVKYFQLFTSPAFLGDVQRLQDLALQTYMMLQKTRPTIKKHTTVRGSTQSATIFREEVTASQMNAQFPYLYWLKFYIELKNVEKETAYSEARLNHIFNNSKNLVKSVDRGSALRYINKYYDDVRSINGSFNYDRYKKFFKQLDKKARPFQDFEQYFKDAMANATYKKY